MRKHNILLFVFFVLFLSCNKDEEQLPDWSEITAKKNGIHWNTKAIAFFHYIDSIPQISISANVLNKNGEMRENLYFGNNPFELGRNIISIRNDNSKINNIYSSYTTLSHDGDVVEDRFVVYDKEENFISIITIDTVNLKLCGNFQVTFIRDINDPIDNTNLPDTMRFTDGEFCLKAKDLR
jgi:hypothetical protein